jgi:hypothetical protein
VRLQLIPLAYLGLNGKNNSAQVKLEFGLSLAISVLLKLQLPPRTEPGKSKPCLVFTKLDQIKM